MTKKSEFWGYLGKCCSIFVVLFTSSLESNPFLVDFPEKKELTNEDYVLLQEKLRAIDLNPLLQQYYKDSIDALGISYEILYSRCTRGIYQTFIDPESGLFPIKELIKINAGSDCCIVSTAPYAAQYPAMLREQTETLQEVGWNGFHLRFFGAFPNPTGKEIRYAGVPYSFKIFAMLEAQKLGFNKVLWLDAATAPQQDLSQLFDQIEQIGFLGIFNLSRTYTFSRMPYSTRSLLYDYTGEDVCSVSSLLAGVFGMKMDHPLTQSFIAQYYSLCELGYPFLSGQPEEAVFTAILHQEPYTNWIQEEHNFALWYPFFFNYVRHKHADYLNCRLPI